jgi:hypothetical protein
MFKHAFRCFRRFDDRMQRFVRIGGCAMKFLLWCVLLILCWPLALFALVLYPIVWLLLLPFRIVGIAVDGVLELVAALIMLPARVLRAV